jgi:pyruvate dehydrogenase E2 component (dihydrolipoamide acetyltransferase)
MYEIVMPQLSDSMEEGKLISWKVNVGDRVSVGQVIAEVESDKAIMEVQAFQNGVVKELLLQEGDTVPVGTVMVRIDTDANTAMTQDTTSSKDTKSSKDSEKVKEVQVEQAQEVPAKADKPPVVSTHSESKVLHKSNNITKGISPKAKAKAAAYGVALEEIMRQAEKDTVHASDVEAYVREKYFTPKALKLLQQYQIDITAFERNHKIDSIEVQAYIDAQELALPQPLSAMQRAIIANVTASAKKPVFHIYEHIDAALFEKHSKYSITMWLVRIFAKVMMRHEVFRATLQNDALFISPNAAIAVAVADAKDLYMPVVHDANKLSMTEIADIFQSFKKKLAAKAFTAQDMQGSTFGISNLGMLGVEHFDAMINKEDAAIVAVGRVEDAKIAITLTADHRLINGYEAALFMQDVKKEAQNPLNFKE